MARHQDLDESNMHEPKHMTTLTGGAADIGKVNVSKGDGSTEARKLVPAEVGLLEHYGQLTVSDNAVGLARTAAVDSTLGTNTDYVKVITIYDAIPHGENNGVTQGVDTMTVTQNGVYRVEMWANLSASINSTVAAFKFAVDGTIGLVRRPKAFMRNAGEFHNVSAYGFVSLTAGQVLDLYMASDKTATITIEDMVLSLTLIRAL